MDLALSSFLFLVRVLTSDCLSIEISFTPPERSRTPRNIPERLLTPPNATIICPDLGSILSLTNIKSTRNGSYAGRIRPCVNGSGRT
ncbi:hypothetical protein BKA56DRAFT_603788 [Ilyonectria sp. MPI-CAGE-AT-0026]|nr:hypothetical protein BKA56DRAFT_603788 [Ilyonectria sp. MPI-CAGE-AT-0026]